MDFRTQYDRVKIVSNPGDYLNPTYSPKVHEDGSIDLVETGVVDTYQEIQAWKDSCDIHAILRKYFNGAYDVVFAFNYRGGQRSNEDFELRRVRFEPNGSGGYFSGIESDIHED